jgi:hypothetical protein
LNVTLRASTGAKILVWRENETFHARPAKASGEPQICLAVDLFEVIAELAGLDLDEGAQAAEAMRLADEAERRLPTSSGEEADGGEPSMREPSRS